MGRKKKEITVVIRIASRFKTDLKKYEVFLKDGGVPINFKNSKSIKKEEIKMVLNKKFKKFDEKVQSAQPGMKSALRAQQSWPILISMAKQRRTIKYEELSQFIGYTDSRPIWSVLGNIMFFCELKELPPLTALVVNKEGVPGNGLTSVSSNELNEKRENVFDFDWYSIVPPSSKIFRQIYLNRKSLNT